MKRDMVGDKAMFYRVKNGSVSLSGDVILENVDFCCKDKDKIGLVGRNGSGKTTFLKTMIGEYSFSDGYDKVVVECSSDFKIGYVEQDISHLSSILMIDYIRDAYPEILSLERQISKCEQKLTGEYQEEVWNKYQSLLDQYRNLGGYSYQKEYENALLKFGFHEEDKEKCLKAFSGGQLTKLSLLRLLLSKPDLLLLDEPTNHLDMEGIEWLEEYLRGYGRAFIVVSHDRMFLDRVCLTIYEISYGTFKRYSGNYSSFLQQKQENYEKELRDYERQQKEIARLQAIADRFRYKPTKAKMALSKLKQIERMVKLDKPKRSEEKTFSLQLLTGEKSYQDVLKVKNLSVGYDRELCSFDFQLMRGDKLGIIGANGTGKSTFLKTLMGEIPPLKGKFRFGEKVRIGYFSQNFDHLGLAHTVYEEVNSSFPLMSSSSIRSLLGAFSFSGDDVFKIVRDLSGGEKVRLSLCKIFATRPNVLILDEPTNHLDISSRETIEKILCQYSGTLLLVSHDRYLINLVCRQVLVLGDGRSKIYPYGYSEYLEKKSLSVENTSGVVDTPMVFVKKKKGKDMISKDKLLQKMERGIDRLEKEIQFLQEESFREENYLNKKKMEEIQYQLEEKQKKLEEKMGEWEKLMEEVRK